MSKYIIQPAEGKVCSVFGDKFLWNDKNIYIMSNHRLALWCWLQCKDVFRGDYSLIHIDAHTDARRWEGPGESECLVEAVKNIESLKELLNYQNLHCACVYRNNLWNKDTRPCITWDNFIHLAISANIFKHYYMYCSIGDWERDIKLTTDQYNYNQDILSINNLHKDIIRSTGKCIVDVDLDFFDKEDGEREDEFPEDLDEWELLRNVFTQIAKQMDSISMITISLNETPDYDNKVMWNKRQKQLEIIREILNIDIPIPIIN